MKIGVLPIEFLKAHLEGINQTHKDDGRSFWHIQIHREGKVWTLYRRKDQDQPDITDKMVLHD